MRKLLPFVSVFFCATPVLHAVGQPWYVESKPSAGSFAVAQKGAAANVYVDDADWAGVIRAAGDLAADIERVTGVAPNRELGPTTIIIGVAGKSPTIDRLAREGKIDVSSIAGKWESFFLQTVRKPLPGVSSALVIAGSDKRGAIYGIYDLSEQIGVSPWYWWADVPVQRRDALYVKAGKFVQGEPAVRYRGIFLNDEAPALSGWTKEKFGGWNHQFYVKVFELILRMKGNFLWPAMWAAAFNEDDPLNPKLADEYGIVMGTSHHEPMLRAQQEWKRHGKGPWDYNANGDVLRQFWTEGIERNKNYESIVSIGMRGDGDMPMAPRAGMAANVALLERIVADQRAIIAQHMNRNPAAAPQLWALYKEVQDYYESGMRVPDDVTLLWSDDNWGNLRRLPTPEERKRGGGAGIYYHFDYVGGPRNYKWLNTVPITKVQEQMNLAYEYDARRIWMVNVGDLKPMEFPIEFFLSFAWNPSRWPHEKVAEFSRLWAEREFGLQYGAEAAALIAQYTKFNGRRKPELIDATTFSVTNYQEADRVSADWNAAVRKAETIYRELPANARDAFFELALFPIKACQQVTDLYIAAGKNLLYAAQGRASANTQAARVKALFQADAALMAKYNHELAGGKWDHMMDQTHIGYTYWQEPPVNTAPKTVELDLPQAAKLGVAVEGSTEAWPGAEKSAALPRFDATARQRSFIDVFNRGREPFDFTATSSAPWIRLSTNRGAIAEEQRVWVEIDWSKAPKDLATGSITVSGAAADPVSIRVEAFTPAVIPHGAFVESSGYISIEAAHYWRKTDTAAAHWETMEDYGRTSSSMSVFPVTAPAASDAGLGPTLEYRVYAFDRGTVQVKAILAPTLNFVPGRGLRYAISFDDQAPQIVDALAHNTQRDWETTVKDGVRVVESTHTLDQPGYHTLKVRMIDAGIVLQKLLLDFGGLRPSYLGPPETFAH